MGGLAQHGEGRNCVSAHTTRAAEGWEHGVTASSPVLTPISNLDPYSPHMHHKALRTGTPPKRWAARFLAFGADPLTTKEMKPWALYQHSGRAPVGTLPAPWQSPSGRVTSTPQSPSGRFTNISAEPEWVLYQHPDRAPVGALPTSPQSPSGRFTSTSTEPEWAWE